jgi:hypothetical protein
MLDKFSMYISLFFLSTALITHILKLVHLLFKPTFLTRYKYFSNNNPSKTDLFLYYILTIGCCCYIIIKNINN